MPALHRIARYAGRPLLMSPEAAQQLALRAMQVDPRVLARSSGMAARPKSFLAKLGLARGFAFEDEEVFDSEARLVPSGYAPAYAGEPEAEGFGWSLVEGIASISIEGALMDRGFYACGEMFWGYDTIAQAIGQAVADSRVKGVFIRMDSPGGVVAGGLEALTEQIRAVRETGNAAGKPIWVFADCAASAAFWISAQADRIIAPAVGLVGSIGAVIVHEDYSGALEKAGVVVTPIQFGAKKTDGAGFKPLSDAAKADLQAEIDEIGVRFIADVLRGREFLGAKALLATQAGVFQAEHTDPARAGRALGLVDDVMSEAAAFAGLKKHVAGAITPSSAPQRAPARGDARPSGAQPTPNTETAPMSKKTNARLRAALARKAMSDEEKLDAIKKILDDAEEADAEDEEEPAAEDETEETTAETEEEEPTAEGEEEETTDDAPAEGDEEVEEDEEEAPATRKGKGKAKSRAARIDAILDLPQAKGREKLAAKLAARGLSVADARELLAAAPKASSLIGNVHDPKLGSGGSGDPKAKSEDEKASGFVQQCMELAGGKKRR